MQERDISSIDFIEKEAEHLKISAIRLLLLDIIKKNQEDGIYGYQIGEKLSLLTEGDLIGSQAGFYAILRRYYKEGLLKTELRDSKTSRPTRKYYFLTPKGESVYNALWQNWIHYYGLISRIFQKPDLIK
jgi:PadR family transcriptional regulator PadR